MAILPPLNHKLDIHGIMWNLGLKLINIGIDPEGFHMGMNKDPVTMSYHIYAIFDVKQVPMKADFLIPEDQLMNGMVTSKEIVDMFFLNIKDAYYPERGEWTNKFINRMLK